MTICRFCFYCLIFFSNAQTFAQTGLQKIYLNPNAADKALQSEFIDSVKFIPLEIRPDVRLGVYDAVTVSEDYFFLNNYSSKQILVFSRRGDFVKKINYKKLGKDFYPQYDEENKIVFFGSNKNYKLTARDKQQIADSWSKPRNKKYYKKYSIDLSDTSFSIRREVPLVSDIIGATSIVNGMRWVSKISAGGNFYKDSFDYELKIYRSNDLLMQFFPYNRIDETKFMHTEERANVSEGNLPGIMYVSRPFCDTIYKWNYDSMVPVYQFVIPIENLWPASIHAGSFKNPTERLTFNMENGWVFRQVFDFYETRQFIWFSIFYLSNYETYIYSKRSQKSFLVKNIRPDSVHYNINLLAGYGWCREGETFYKPIKYEELSEYIANNKEVRMPENIERFLKSKPSPASPIIVEYKLKN